MAPHINTESRRYCGTIHFPTDHTQWADAAHCINTDPFTRFFICQPEICPTSGKLYVQFYVEFQSPKALSAAKATQLVKMMMLRRKDKLFLKG